MVRRGQIGTVKETRREESIELVEWDIPGTLPLSAEVGDFYVSPFFKACGGVWYLLIYPNGRTERTPQGCDLILIRWNNDAVQTFSLTAGIKGVEGRRTVTKEFSPRNRGCSWLGFCQWSELNDGNSLIITLDVMSHEARDSSTQTVEVWNEANVPTEDKKSSGKKGVEELVKCLQGLLESKRETDVIINVKDKEFPAHRLMLQARSPVFEAMFSHDMVEKQSGVVKMEDCDPDTFPDFLQHVYTGSVDMISASNVFTLYAASDKYDMAILKQECSNFMKNNMTVASFCKTMALALRHDDRALTERATEFFCDNSIHVVKTAEWQIFMAENVTVANELIIKVLSKP